MRARIVYINYTKKLRIFILNYFCVVYVCAPLLGKVGIYDTKNKENIS